MKKQGIGRLSGVSYPYGSVCTIGRSEAKDSFGGHQHILERDDYIIPESVKLDFYGEKLTPTQFDSHGNPQIDGVANLILCWKLRQKARDGIIDPQYGGTVSYEYETTDGRPLVIPFEKRVPQVDICPICGERLTVHDLDGSDEIVEDFGGGMISKHWEPRVTRLRDFGAIVHSKCANEFYRLRMIDDITETVNLAFDCYDIDKENRFEWGKGERDMWYELIPNEYCPTPERGCCEHRPWFMFHTPIGNIKIGWRKRVINITFMANFAPFDMSIFDSENVTKGVSDDGARTIHAWDGKEKMYEYLVRVRKTVLPNKEK